MVGVEGVGEGEGGRGREGVSVVHHGVLGQQLPREGVQHGVGALHELGTLVALPAAQEGTVVEHVLRHGVQGPEVALPGVAGLPRDLDEAIVEGEVVSD